MEKVVLDLETKKSFDQVAGRKLELLGVSVVGIYSYQQQQFKVFTEQELPLLADYLKRADLIIGFNIKKFDYPVLQPYLDLDLQSLNTLDMLEEVKHNLGFRLSLNSLASAALPINKSGTGLDALRYFRLGQIDKLKQYCQQDVLVTREVYEYGRKHGHLLYRRGVNLETIPVSWGEGQQVQETLNQAWAKRLTLEIEYSAARSKNGQNTRRKIDIYDLALGKIVAYCHLRQQLRTFNVRRVLSAKLTKEKYQIPADFNPEKFKAGQAQAEIWKK